MHKSLVSCLLEKLEKSNSDQGARPEEERTSLQKHHSMNDQSGEDIRSSSSSSAEQRRGNFSVDRSRSADEIREQSSFSSLHIAEQTTDDRSFGSTTGMATFDSEHGGKSKETPSARAARTKITGKAQKTGID